MPLEVAIGCLEITRLHGTLGVVSNLCAFHFAQF